MIYGGREIDVVDVAWAAGFLDGEGCFTITRSRKKRQHAARVTAFQIVQAPLDKLQGLFGGSLATHPVKANERPGWKWEMYGARAMRDLLPALIPFLVVKRKQAELLLDFAEQIDSRRGGRSSTLTDDELNLRETYCEVLAGMK